MYASLFSLSFFPPSFYSLHCSWSARYFSVWPWQMKFGLWCQSGVIIWSRIPLVWTTTLARLIRNTHTHTHHMAICSWLLPAKGSVCRMRGFSYSTNEDQVFCMIKPQQFSNFKIGRKRKRKQLHCFPQRVQDIHRAFFNFSSFT